MNSVKFQILLFILLSIQAMGQFNCLRVQGNMKQSTKAKPCSGLDGRLYIPTLNGLLVYDGQEISEINNGSKDGVLVKNTLRNIHFDQDSTIWILYSYGGYTQVKKDTVIHQIGVGGPSDHLCFSIFEYRDTLYLCTKNGVYPYLNDQFLPPIKPSKRGINIYHQGKLTNDIRRISVSKENPDQLYLYGGGLYTYNLKTDELEFIKIPKRFLKDFGSYDNKSDSYLFNDLLETKTSIFLTSWGGGLFEIDKKDMSWNQYLLAPYTDKKPLNENIIFEVIPYENESLLCSTKENVLIFNTKSQSFEQPKNELQAFNIATKGGIRMNTFSNKIILAGYQNICLIESKNEERISLSNSSTLQLTEVLLDGQSTNMGNIFYPKFMQDYKSHQRNISFRYALPNPFGESHYNYEYRLKGRNNQWTSNGNSNNISFPDLNGGKYTLEIRVKNHDQNYVYSAPFNFTIEKYIYEKWWFWSLIVLGLIGIIATFIGFKWNQQKKEKALEAKYNLELAKLEMSALRAQMNPHFLFNSLNSIKNFALTKGPKETATYLSKFSHLIRLILQNSKNPMVNLKDELEALQLYIEIEALRFENKFRFNFFADSGLSIHSIQIPPLILQPYVENAIWHGLMHKREKDGMLSISVKDMGSYIQCMIEDNGIGRENAKAIKKQNIYKKQKSLGMEITSDRIAITNKIYNINTEVKIIDLYDVGGQASGTRVLVNIPKTSDNFS